MKKHISKKLSKSRLIFVLLFVLSLTLVIDFPVNDTLIIFPIESAEAVRGRPATPRSAAGVHRRVRRRTVRRIAIGTRIYALPVGYTIVVVSHVTYYVHDDVYYKPYYEGNKVVYVVVEEP